MVASQILKKILSSRLRRNLFSGYAASIWATLIQIVSIPIYIRFMGIESYGLIGFYLILQSTLQILDLGLSPTINRELARHSASPESAADVRDLVRTLEFCCWSIGITIGVIITVCAPFISFHWIKADNLSPDMVRRSIMLMGFLLAIYWPLNFYQGGLMGLQKHVVCYTIQIVAVTLNNGGAILILWLVSPTITAFLTWNIIVNSLRTFIVLLSVWWNLPPSPRTSRIRLAVFVRLWRFVAGINVMSVLSLIVTQMDKIILSKLLNLSWFGYYTLAGSMASGLTVIGGPVYNVVFPRFSALIVQQDKKTLEQFFVRSFQLLAVLVIPVGIIISVFSHDILWLWTRNVDVAKNVAPIASIMVIGTALNILTIPSYALQLADGKTKHLSYIYGCSILILVPLIVFMAFLFGGIGTAICWVLFNTSYLVILLIISAKWLPEIRMRWYLLNLVRPIMVSLGIVAAGRQFFVKDGSILYSLFFLIVITAIALTATALVTPSTRKWLEDIFRKPEYACAKENRGKRAG